MAKPYLPATVINLIRQMATPQVAKLKRDKVRLSKILKAISGCPDLPQLCAGSITILSADDVCRANTPARESRGAVRAKASPTVEGSVDWSGWYATRPTEATCSGHVELSVAA